MRKDKILIAAIVVLAIGFILETAYLWKLTKNVNAAPETPAYKVAPRTQSRQTSAQPTPRHFVLSSGWANDPWNDMDMWDPFEEMRQIRSMMNRMFDDSFERMEAPNASITYIPRTDVKELPNEYRIVLDLPGIDKDKINVKVEGNVLTVSGERNVSNEETKDQEGRTVYKSQRSFGSFLRTFPLPADADTARLTAESKNGVLTVVIPRLANKDEKKETKKINVQ
jgi:HSP20 family protein